MYEIFVASDGAMHVKGFISAEFDEGKRQFMGKPVLGTDSMLPELRDKGIRQFIVAIGDSRIRERLHADAARWGFVPVTAVHPWAAISPSAQLGRDVAIMAGAVVNANTRAADGAIVNRGATVDHDCLLESFSHVCPGAHLAGNVSVGERAVVGIGASVVEVEGARITRLVEPPFDLFINGGIYILGEGVRRFVTPREYMDVTDLVDALLQENMTVSAFPIREYRVDIGQMREYKVSNIAYTEHFRR